MSYSCSDLVADLGMHLEIAGYLIYNGNAETSDTVDDESGDDWWFTWTQLGCDIEVGQACTTSLGATSDAMCHFFNNARINRCKQPTVK